MSQIDLAGIKPLVSLSEGDGGHDDVLTGFIDAAEASFKAYLRRDLDAEFPEGWPADLLQALRLQVADWYEQTFGSSGARLDEMHPSVKRLLAPHRSFGG